MSATTASPARPLPAIGELLREWRRRRRLSQLDVSLEAAVSARHLSFVETGRSKPSRELVLHLADYLDVPLRERNALLLAAGYAPVYGEHPLDADQMAPVRDALDAILGGLEPFPAIVMDQRWNLVNANRPALEIMSDGVDPALLAPPVNTLRATLHPDGIAPRIVNLAQYGAHLLHVVQRQAALLGDPRLHELHDELLGYPGVEPGPHAPDQAQLPFVPLRLRQADGGEWAFFNTTATFGTALDVTMAELSIESLFPADADTAAALRERYG